MKFDNAKIALRDAALKIGSELFTHEALLKLGQIRSDCGVEGAEEELKTAEFVNSIFNVKSAQDEKNKVFWELLTAIHILIDNEKQ